MAKKTLKFNNIRVIKVAILNMHFQIRFDILLLSIYSLHVYKLYIKCTYSRLPIFSPKLYELCKCYHKNLL